MPGVLTDVALDTIQDPGDRRVHLVRPETIRPLDNGMSEALTLCGERVVGYPSDEPVPATCACCLGKA